MRTYFDELKDALKASTQSPLPNEYVAISLETAKRLVALHAYVNAHGGGWPHFLLEALDEPLPKEGP